jgi:hypothetical protein
MGVFLLLKVFSQTYGEYTLSFSLFNFTQKILRYPGSMTGVLKGLLYVLTQ